MKNTKDEELKIKAGMLVLLKPTEKEPKWVSIGVDAVIAQRISSDSKMAQLLLNKKVGDTIDFGRGFKIL